MARSIQVEVIVDSTRATTGFAKTGAAASKMDKDLQHAVKGALSGSGAFEHLGRSLAFASGGFVAFAGASEALRASIDAARDTQVAQKALAAQIKTSGETFQASQQAIDKAGLSIAKFGFTSEDSLQALTILDRATGSVSKSIQYQGIAANIARAKNISLSQAALILGKAYDGQTTSLKRLGVEIPKGVKGYQAINIAAQKFAGQARANTTEAQRFSATLHDTEVIIGTALLPTLNKLLTEIGAWLTKMNQSGRLQRDVNTAVKDGTAAFEVMKAIIVPLAAAFQGLGKAVGGTKNELELLLGVFAAFKGAALLREIGLVSTAVGGIGASAVVAGGEVDALDAKLGLLARNPALAIAGLTIADVLLGKKALTTQATAGFAGGAHGSPYQKGSDLNDLFQAGLAGKSGTISVPNGGTINTNNLSAMERKAYADGLKKGLLAQAHGIAGFFKGLGQTSGVPKVSVPSGTAGGSYASGSLSGAGTLLGGGRFSGSGVDLSLRHFGLPGAISGSYADRRLTGLRLPGKISGSMAGEGYSLPLSLQLLAAKAGAGIGTSSAAAAQIKKYDEALLKSHRLSLQGQIDVYNDIAQQNSILGNTVKQTAAISSRKLLAGIHFASLADKKAAEGAVAAAQAHGGHLTPLAAQVLHVNLDGKTIAKVVTGHQNKQTLRNTSSTRN